MIQVGFGQADITPFASSRQWVNLSTAQRCVRRLQKAIWKGTA
jgi:hypothetical protein